MSSTTVPFELNGNKPLVQARVNGRGPYSFLLDNGSSYNVVDTKVAEGLGIASYGSDDQRGAGEATLRSAFAPAQLGLGDVELPESEVVVMPIDETIALAGGRHIHGLFGYPLFDRYAVELCYVGSNAVLHEPGEVSGGEPICIDVVREHAMVEATLVLRDERRVRGTFMVDTASRSPLLLTRPFAEDNRIADGLDPTLTATSGWGIGGPTRELIGRAARFDLGGLSFEAPIVSCATARAGVLAERGFAGIIGGEILRRCHVVIDYSRGVMLLEPSAAFGEPFEYDQSGLFVVVEDDLTVFRVYEVLPESPGAEAGIEAGDVMLSLNGIPAVELSLDGVKAGLRAGPGTLQRLELERDGARFERTLALRRLV